MGLIPISDGIEQVNDKIIDVEIKQIDEKTLEMVGDVII